MYHRGATALAVAVSLFVLSASAGASSGRTGIASGMNPSAIIGGDTNAIIGGDRHKAKRPSAIIGGDTNAIIGGDINAIIGGDTNAIIGGDRHKAKRPSAIVGGGARSAVSSAVLANGPLDWVNPSNGRVQVLGQQFLANISRGYLEELATRVTSGEIVTAVVTGTLSPDGKPKPQSMHFSDQQHIPGATSVAVVGKVQRLNRSIARLVIGDLAVDYTAALASGTLAITEGSIIEVSGVKMSGTSELTATAVQVVKMPVGH